MFRKKQLVTFNCAGSAKLCFGLQRCFGLVGAFGSLAKRSQEPRAQSSSLCHFGARRDSVALCGALEDAKTRARRAELELFR